jgi:hypothetical protein
MPEFTKKQNQTRKGNSVDTSKSRKITPKGTGDEHPILQLQRAIGNRAVLKMLRSRDHTRYANAGAAADRSEQEAKRNGPQGEHVPDVASEGIAGPSAPLPHLKTIQRSFGTHDISGVEAHISSQAADANRALGAVGYAVGNHVAFAAPPDLHTAAHEAAHIVQQRKGVQLSGGAARAGDNYERHADAVADQVVNGQQAGPLLDRSPGYAGKPREGATGAGAVQKSDQPVQMQTARKQTQTTQPGQPTDPKQPQEDKLAEARRERFQQILKEWMLMDAIKGPVVHKLTEGYLNRPGKLKMSDRVILDTPYGGNKVIPAHEPTYKEVYIALYNAIDMKKIGKGYSPTDWEWSGAPRGKQKTPDQKLLETGEFAATEYLQNKAEKTAVKATVKWLTDRSLVATATLLVEAAVIVEVIGVVTLVLGVVELLKSLGEPSELSPYQQKNADIVSSVKAWLQGKEEADALKESLSRPSRFETKPAVRSTTRVGP